MKQRLCAFLLLLALCVSLFTIPAYAESAILTFDPMETEGGHLNGASPWRYAELGEPLGELPVPVNEKPYMYFEGWFNDDFTEEITADTICTGSMVIHALWMEGQGAKELPFTDVADDWSYEGIDYCYQNGLMNGTGGTVFSPNDFCTRAMVVTVLYRMDGYEDTYGMECPFTDLTQDWYHAAVTWAANAGIVNGTGPNTFAPNDNITREQLATILYRYAEYKLYDCHDSASLAGFSDTAEVSSFAVEAMQWAVAKGLITGVKNFDGSLSLDPKGNATRAQIAAILFRFAMAYSSVEISCQWENVALTLPAWWSNYVAIGSEEDALCFRCRPEMEAGNGGLLFSLCVMPPEECRNIPSAYEVPGAIRLDGEYFNVVFIYPGDVETSDYFELYKKMFDDLPAIIHTLHGCNGAIFSVG